jgi:hypothetical protein
MKQLIALVMIAFLVPTTAALAKNACKDDKTKFCKDAKATGKKVRDCLKEHSAELSPACKESLDKPVSDAEKKAKKAKKGQTGEKAGDHKPADAMKPTETKPAESAPSDTPPSAPASPGGAEDQK